MIYCVVYARHQVVFYSSWEIMLLLIAAFWLWQGFMMSPEDERLWSKNKAFGLASAPGIPLLLYMFWHLELKYKIKWLHMAQAPFCYKTSYILPMGKFLLETH